MIPFSAGSPEMSGPIIVNVLPEYSGHFGGMGGTAAIQRRQNGRGRGPCPIRSARTCMRENKTSATLSARWTTIGSGMSVLLGTNGPRPTSRPVREDGAVKAAEDVVDRALRHMVKDVLLHAVRVEDPAVLHRSICIRAASQRIAAEEVLIQRKFLLAMSRSAGDRHICVAIPATAVRHHWIVECSRWIRGALDLEALFVDALRADLFFARVHRAEARDHKHVA